jgi:transglutaminase-like putative cysteine protease
VLNLLRTRLGQLPRDGRDTLFLLAVIGWVILPQVTRLPLWCSLLVALVLVWRGQLALSGRPLPSWWWVLGLLALTIAATLFTHRTLLGRDAGVTLVVVLLTLKTLELRAKRDAFVVFFLSFFAMLTNFFFSQSLLTAAAMLVALLGLLTALVNAHMPVGRPPLMKAARTAATMALLGAPIMALLFVLFPRIAPLWGIPSDGLSGRSGLSASMEVGTIATLALDDSIALRIRFDGQQPPMREMYFRGPVLSNFDGRQWLPLGAGRRQRYWHQAELQLDGPTYRYEVTMEPSMRPWVFVLEAAAATPILPGHSLTMTADLQWLSNRPISELVRYKAQSRTEFRHGPERMVTSLAEFLDLPPGFNPRTLAWAAELRRDPRFASARAQVLANHLLAHLRDGGYGYTLEPGLYGRDTADEFWFDRKQGFCEHIASSFVVLMRALNIPARIVTGYQGGEVNNFDGFWTLRQRDAHAWVEIWDSGQGWQRVDPTGAVSPGRVGTATRLTPPVGVAGAAMSAVLGTVNVDLVRNLRAMWEAANNSWNQWVLNYSQARQLNLLRDIGFDAPSWTDLAYLLIGLVVLASSIGALWTLWERYHIDPWLRLLHKAQQRLRARGVTLADSSPPRQLAEMARERFGAQGAALCDWLLRLEAQRYARHSARDLAPLRREFRRLTWPAA